MNKMQAKTQKKTVTYDSRFINENFIIKVYEPASCGKPKAERMNKAVGVQGAIALIGEDFLYKFVTRALEHGLDKEVCKLRRGLQVTLYIH